MKTIHSPKLTMMLERKHALQSIRRKNAAKYTVAILFLVSSFFFSTSIFAQNTYSAMIMTNKTADISSITKTGSTYENGVATIKWSVENENNFCVYVVEKSNDQENFVPFGKVIRRENETKAEYAFVDTKPYSGTGYYRLLVIYKDGAYDYAPAGVINETALESVSASPEIIH